jgi:ubiquinone/menaquinone biosynthesis C-methylase UbiE
MCLYERFVLPRAVHRVCSSGAIAKRRAVVVPWALGRVVEVGVGSGLNLPFYVPGSVENVFGVDPSVELLAMAVGRAQAAPVSVTLVPSCAEDIPLASSWADTVLVTYALCTIPRVEAALREMHRVLAPGGALVFCEHGMAPDAEVRRVQDRANGLWRLVGGGCNLNRPIPMLIRQGGFEIVSLEERYVPGWKPVSYTYLGRAVRV